MFLLSDSIVAIFLLLTTPRKTQVYVANRANNLTEIHYTLLYIPGNENQADYTATMTSISKY